MSKKIFSPCGEIKEVNEERSDDESTKGYKREDTINKSKDDGSVVTQMTNEENKNNFAKDEREWNKEDNRNQQQHDKDLGINDENETQEIEADHQVKERSLILFKQPYEPQDYTKMGFEQYYLWELITQVWTKLKIREERKVWADEMHRMLQGIKIQSIKEFCDYGVEVNRKLLQFGRRIDNEVIKKMIEINEKDSNPDDDETISTDSEESNFKEKQHEGQSTDQEKENRELIAGRLMTYQEFLNMSTEVFFFWETIYLVGVGLGMDNKMRSEWAAHIQSQLNLIGIHTEDDFKTQYRDINQRLRLRGEPEMGEIIIREMASIILRIPHHDYLLDQENIQIENSSSDESWESSNTETAAESGIEDKEEDRIKSLEGDHFMK